MSELVLASDMLRWGRQAMWFPIPMPQIINGQILASVILQNPNLCTTINLRAKIKRDHVVQGRILFIVLILHTQLDKVHSEHFTLGISVFSWDLINIPFPCSVWIETNRLDRHTSNSGFVLVMLECQDGCEFFHRLSLSLIYMIDLLVPCFVIKQETHCMAQRGRRCINVFEGNKRFL